MDELIYAVGRRSVSWDRLREKTDGYLAWSNGRASCDRQSDGEHSFERA